MKKKYRAAEFIIANSPIQHSYNWYDNNSGKIIDFNDVNYSDFSEAKTVIDSMLNNPEITPKQIKTWDIETAQAKNLGRNVSL